MPEITLWHWIAFAAFVAAMLILDLGVFHRRSRESTLREAAVWTLIWCALALAFNGIVFVWLGRTAGAEFLTGYLIEWSLSMDNVFVFAVIFSYFMVPLKYQYRVLFWGILGAVVMRLSFVLAGAELIHRFEWILAFFGVFLVYSGIQLTRHGDSQPHPEKNLALRLAKRVFPVATGDTGQRFFVRQRGRLCITPLFLVLLVVESTDVVFACDSVPAIFGVVSKNTDYFEFVVFTSNVFAVLGLRALYFLLAGVMNTFRYLKYGLSAILVFVGLKMLAEYFFEAEGGGHLLPPWASLLTVLSLLGISIVASIVAQRRESGGMAAPHDVTERTTDDASHREAASGEHATQTTREAARDER